MILLSGHEQYYGMLAMWTDLLLDKAVITVVCRTIIVRFTHWLKRSKGFSVELDSVARIEAVQIEPCTMQMIFFMEDGARSAISEEMAGFNAAVEFVESYFAGFDAESYEKAKGDIGVKSLCWRAS